ncbi:MAG: PEP-CTERM sorting domain-containing protein [Syntrophales bacterium]
MKKILRILAVTLVLSLWGIPGVQATTVTLSDMNSTATISPNSQAGMNSWFVDGISMLYQQWFWYRIGATGGEKSIDTISAPTILSETTNTVSLLYSNVDKALSVQVNYSLFGGTPGSRQSDIDEQIRLRNISSSRITLHFFQYSDFDLGGYGPHGYQNDTVKIDPDGNKVDQSNPYFALAETVVTPPASRYEAGYYATTLNELNDASPTTLNDNLNAGPGDTTWAFEWDVTLAPGQTYLISKDKDIRPVPEPGTLLLLGFGLLGVATIRRKK